MQRDKAPHEILQTLSFRQGPRTFNDLYTEDLSGFSGNAVNAALRVLLRRKLITADRSGDDPVYRITLDGERALAAIDDKIKRED